MAVSWTIKKAELWRIDAFELWYWRRLLRVPWTARRSNQLILKKISPEYSLEGLMLKPKLEYFPTWCEVLTHWKRPWRQEEKGTTEDEIVGWHQRLNGQRAWVGSGSWRWTGKPGVLQSMGSKELDTTERLNWTELNWLWYSWFTMLC